MFYLETTIFLYILQICLCNWVSEWMNPIKEQIKQPPIQTNNVQDLTFGEENLKAPQLPGSLENPEAVIPYNMRRSMSTTSLKMKLESTLQNAKVLADSLRLQITEMTTRETALKEAIFNGRSGVSYVTVKSMGRPAHVYLVRDGVWTSCSGTVQLPTQAQNNNNLFNDIFSVPRCVGKEISTKQDPCVFNSIIKYETVPTVRREEYIEEDFLCLKKSFNSTLEQYLSVPKQTIDETCKNGIVRRLEDNVAKCGIRIMTEYTYYPTREYSISSSLPMEYCSESDSSCKLIIAWHVSNSSIDNFEFLKDDPGFKKFFIKTDNNIQHIM